MAAPTKPEILEALHAEVNELEATLQGVSDEVWASGDEDRWGPAHHLAHLIASCERTAQGFAARERLPRHPANTSRSFDEVKELYLGALARVPAQALKSNPVPPDVPPAWTREDAAMGLRAALEQLETSLEAWSESDLDARALPHPLLGPLSAREFLQFTRYHTAHHQRGVVRCQEDHG